jgi:hypothetical protein
MTQNDAAGYEDQEYEELAACQEFLEAIPLPRASYGRAAIGFCFFIGFFIGLLILREPASRLPTRASTKDFGS